MALEDPYFGRIWKALQYKKAGIPVLELVTSLDDSLCIQAVESAISEHEHEQRESKREAERQRGGGRDDKTHPPRDLLSIQNANL
uniref:Uncharacterized protein n=1 Tax=viral metagenome TaxID=1070528 RepID=A0A6M3LAY6_9ZZZZ